jgi:hypothetical protein
LTELRFIVFSDAKQKNRYCTQDIFYDSITGWAVNHPELVVNRDVHNIASLAQALYVSFFHLHHSINNHAVELTRRHVIDDIFMGRNGSTHSIV